MNLKRVGILFLIVLFVISLFLLVNRMNKMETYIRCLDSRFEMMDARTNSSIIRLQGLCQKFLNVSEKLSNELNISNDKIKKVNGLQLENKEILIKEVNRLRMNEFIRNQKQKWLEQKLLQINIFISNKTAGAIGSGVTLKYKGKFYILTACHMMQTPEDNIHLYENGNDVGKLKIIKYDVDTDLMLMKPEDEDLVPKVYTEVSEVEPVLSEKLYIVGNPNGVEDVLGEVRVVSYTEIYIYIQGFMWFGNSGGGIYNDQGKLVGICSHMKAEVNESSGVGQLPVFYIGGFTRLRTITNFLETVNE